MSCCNGKCDSGRACPQHLAQKKHAEGVAIVARARRMHLAKVQQYNAKRPIDPVQPDTEPAPAPVPSEPGLWAHWGYWVAVALLVVLSVAIVAGGLDHLYARWSA
jgi:hypothetical protein